MRYGRFDDPNREYLIERPDIPVSWTNYLGVKELCGVISHNAGGYLFYQSPEHHRITRFRPNAIPLDRPGFYVYLRDDQTGEYWSISWQPTGKDLNKAQYSCHHGLSYSKFVCDYLGVRAEQTMFIPIDDQVLLWDVKLHNTTDRPRRLSVFSYLEFSFHHIEIDNQNLQMSLYAGGCNYQDGIIEYDFFYEPWTYHFFCSNFVPDGFDCVRDRFIGPYRTETNPQAVESGHCTNSAELGGNHCGALHKRLCLEPGEESRLVFMLGVGSRDKQGYGVKQHYHHPKSVDLAFNNLAEYWHNKTSRLQVKTPNPGLDSMINTWTLYQAETCVVWSRFASFIEVGGRTGLGYRDTSQDIMSVVHTNPEKCKQRILELLQAQVAMGYGLHLFDPDVFKPKNQSTQKIKPPTVVPAKKPADIIHGIEDVCADDALWLVVAIIEYIKETGEIELFDQLVPFADSGSATVYEHLKRALDFSAEQTGQDGICKGLRADWNDCLNLGGGQSAMVSFMHHWALQAFVDTARYLGRSQDAQTYQTLAEKVKETCEKTLWDGDWYIRGITATGLRIGSRSNEQGKIFINSQTWAVLSGVAQGERAQQCMACVDELLYSKYGLHLLWPAYTHPNDEIGFVTRVYPGIKENAAIFSHANPWAVIAACILGKGDKALHYYDAMCPYHQNDQIEVRQAEPYSYCQFVIGKNHPAFGTARHPWLTGSAGWAYTAATRWILGIRLELDGMVIDPCIPPDWQGFELVRKWKGATYHIRVENPHGVHKGVRSVVLDGKPVSLPIPPQADGFTHHINVTMGTRDTAKRPT